MLNSACKCSYFSCFIGIGMFAQCRSFHNHKMLHIFSFEQ
jgi:hypothetical protein